MFQKIIIGIICCVVGIGIGVGTGIYLTTTKYSHAAELAAAELKSTNQVNEIFRDELSSQIDHITADVTTIQEEIVQAVLKAKESGTGVDKLRNTLTELYSINEMVFVELEDVKESLQLLKLKGEE